MYESETIVNRLPLSHASIISMYGGIACAETIETLLSSEVYASVSNSVQFIQNGFNAILVNEGKQKVCHFYLVNSASYVCRMHSLTDGDAIIVLPVGMIARLSVGARMLLQYWDKNCEFHLMNGVTDDIEEVNWTMPEKLIPLFGPYKPEDESQFWQDILELNRSIELPSLYEEDVVNLLHLGIVHLAAHEFGHFWQRHSVLKTIDVKNEFLVRHNLTHADIKKGIELHADAVAGGLSMLVMLAQIKPNPGVQDDLNTLYCAFLRLSYIATMLYGLYEPRRKYIGAYDNDDSYTHPLVRRQLAVRSANSRLKYSEFSQLLPVWHQAELEGWVRCIQALNCMNMDCWEGKYGTYDADRLIFPVHNNPGGYAGAHDLDQKVTEASTFLETFIVFLEDFFADS